MSNLHKEDLDKVKRQENILQFTQFSKSDAWELGNLIRAKLLAFKAPAILDIRLGDECLFYTSLDGATLANQDWARRKRNLVMAVGMSSYRLSLETKLGSDVVVAMGLDPRDYVAAGGCFPIQIRETGIIGTITISGLPERDDHKVVVEAVAEFLDVTLGDAAL